LAQFIEIYVCIYKRLKAECKNNASVVALCFQSFVQYKIAALRTVTLLKDAAASVELDNADFPETKLIKKQTIRDNLSLYRLDATIIKDDLNGLIDEYKNKLKDKATRGFSGFRRGYIPPYALADVYRYVVSFAVEGMLTKLSEVNGLKVWKIVQ
jgi:hypothetical protein